MGANVVIRTHYFKDDVNFDGDYTSVAVRIEGVLARTWGDDYHDHGAEKAEAWVQGWIAAMLLCRPSEVVVAHEKVADYAG